MAMLAEPRRRVRYSINPNGNSWSNDSNGFGKKMLEKMGWSTGKGLGANMDGVTTHVKLHYKCDQQGIGFEDKADQWTAHEDNFTQLLKNLQSNGHVAIEDNVEASDEIGRQSLELQSKSLRARVHYQKFTRGKDLSQYSSKDLANIFGRSALEKKANSEVKQECNDESNNVKPVVNGGGKDEKKFGVPTLQGGSMTDYFKKKMTQIKLTFASSKPKGDEMSEDESERIGFGYAGSSITSCTDDKNEKLHVKASNFDIEDRGMPNLKSDKDDEIGGLMNEGFEVANSNCSSSLALNPNPFEIVLKEKKKSKKHKHNNELTAEVALNDEQSCSKHKKKKQSKQTNEQGIENPIFDDNSLLTSENIAESENCDVTPNNMELKRKDKKRKFKKEKGLDNPTFNESLSQSQEDSENINANNEILINPYEIASKKAHKKSKKQKLAVEEIGIVNPLFGDSINDSLGTEVKNQEKKSNALSTMKVLEELGSHKGGSDKESSAVISAIENINTTLRKKKKKSKKVQELVAMEEVQELDGGSGKATEVEHSISDGMNIAANRKKNKLKTAEESVSGEEVPETEPNTVDSTGIEMTTLLKKKKKKPKTELFVPEEIDVLGGYSKADNIDTNVSLINASKKKKKKLKIEESSFTMEEIVEIDDQITKQDNTVCPMNVELNVSSTKRKMKLKTAEENKDLVLASQCDKEADTFLSTNLTKKQNKTKPVDGSCQMEELHHDESTKKSSKEVTADEGEDKLEDALCLAGDLIMNVSSYEPRPILSTPHAPRRRKSVRIDESLNQEHIIPNLVQLKRMASAGDDDEAPPKRRRAQQHPLDAGIDNPAFRCVQDELAATRRILEHTQAEVENDLNECRQSAAVEQDAGRFIGTIADLEEHVRLADEDGGHVRLAFRHANLTQTMDRYERREGVSAPLKSYRHLVKGDVELVFSGTNLHVIRGYATLEALAWRKRQAAVASRRGSLVMPMSHLTNMEVIRKLTAKHRRKRLLLQKKKVGVEKGERSSHLDKR